MFTCRVVWGEFYFKGLLYFCTITCWNTQETVRNSIYLSFGAQSFYLAFIGLDYSSVSKLNSLAGLWLPELSFIQILSHYVICYPVIYSFIISCLFFSCWKSWVMSTSVFQRWFQKLIFQVAIRHLGNRKRYHLEDIILLTKCLTAWRKLLLGEI